MKNIDKIFLFSSEKPLQIMRELVKYQSLGFINIRNIKHDSKPRIPNSIPNPKPDPILSSCPIPNPIPTPTPSLNPPLPYP